MNYHKKPVSGDKLTIWLCIACLALVGLAIYATENLN